MPSVLHIELHWPHVPSVELQTLWQAALSVGHAFSASKAGVSVFHGRSWDAKERQGHRTELGALGDDDGQSENSIDDALWIASSFKG